MAGSTRSKSSASPIPSRCALSARLIAVSGPLPSRRLGRPWGYADLLGASNNPNHERHAEFTEWIGNDFDPDDDDADSLTAEVATPRQNLVRKSTRKRTRCC
jgi:hypothetical protein